MRLRKNSHGCPAARCEICSTLARGQNPSQSNRQSAWSSDKGGAIADATAHIWQLRKATAWLPAMRSCGLEMIGIRGSGALENQEILRFFQGMGGQAGRVRRLPSTRIIRQGREKFAPAIQQCAQAGAGDMTSFSLQLRVQKEGIVDSVRSFPQTAVGFCLAKLNGETLSPPP